MLLRWDTQWPDWWVMILSNGRQVVEEEVLQVDQVVVPVDLAVIVLALLVRVAAWLHLR